MLVYIYILFLYTEHNHQPGICAEWTHALEIPNGPLLQLPGGRVIDGVDVANEGHVRDVALRDLLRGHYDDGPSLEHDSTVGSAGVVEYTCKQVDASPKRVRTRVPKTWHLILRFRWKLINVQIIYSVKLLLTSMYGFYVNCYEALVFACGTFMQRTENFHHQVKAVGWGRNVNKKR